MNNKKVMRNIPIIGITVDIKDEYLMLKHHYSDAIVSAGGVPILIPPTGNPLPYVEIINGLLIPGGNDLDPFYYNEEITPTVKPVSRQRSDFEISLLKEMVNLKKPVLGICYGMQLINVALGGTLYQDIDTFKNKTSQKTPHGVDSKFPVEINHKNGYHIIVIAENMFLRKGEFSVNSTHHQAVKKLGTGLIDFAHSMDNLIEAFYMGSYPFLIGVQWHPERLMDDRLSLDLFHSFVKASNETNL